MSPWLLASALLCCTTTAFAQHISSSDTVTITWDGASAPLGRFLLITDNKAICAVKFTSAQRSHDQRPATTFDSGEENLVADYDWWFQPERDRGFGDAAVTSGHATLHRRPLKGIGRLAFQTGSIYLKCGRFHLRWQYPSWVSFWGAEKRGDYGILLAPTPWRELGEIDLLDERLQWHRYDEVRQFRELPLLEYWPEHTNAQRQ